MSRPTISSASHSSPSQSATHDSIRQQYNPAATLLYIIRAYSLLYFPTIDWITKDSQLNPGHLYRITTEHLTATNAPLNSPSQPIQLTDLIP